MEHPTAREVLRTHWRKLIVETALFGIAFLLLAFGLAFLGAE